MNAIREQIELSFPARALHPNARVHWSKRSKSAKVAREEARLTAIAAGWRRMELPDGPVRLLLAFFPPDKRKRDDDGLIAAFKAYRDGLADALGIDDNRFITSAKIMPETAHGGVVTVSLQPDER